MAGKGNSFRKNASHEAGGKSSERRKYDSRRTDQRLSSGSTVVAKLLKILGLFLLGASIYFLIAFISYLFTWQEDQSYISMTNGSWNTLFKTREELELAGVTHPVVENWMGKLGALLAHQFIYKWFGVASFIFIGVLFIIGYRLLLKVKLISIWKTLVYSALSILFISVTTAYIHGFMTNYPHFMEGEFGFWTNR